MLSARLVCLCQQLLLVGIHSLDDRVCKGSVRFGIVDCELGLITTSFGGCVVEAHLESNLVAAISDAACIVLA